jgi:hypothetical protein
MEKNTIAGVSLSIKYPPRGSADWWFRPTQKLHTLRFQTYDYQICSARASFPLLVNSC